MTLLITPPAQCELSTGPLSTTADGGRPRRATEHLSLARSRRHRPLLRPIGVDAVPENIESAIHLFLDRRDELERRCSARRGG
jgi:hypothetical protein